jgi:hypothetical protein
MQVIRQRYYMEDEVQLAWRPIEPYCIQEIQYYDLTRHYAGDDGKGDRFLNYTISGYATPDGIMFQRRKADGTVMQSEIPNNTRITHPFISDDVVGTTVPLNKLRALHARYHKVKELLFNPSVDTPNLEELKLRGNWTSLGDLDMTNCKNLKVFDTSMCYINSLKLPPTGPNDPDNNFIWAYIGHYSDVGGRSDMPPVSVVDELTKRAYYSNVSPTAANGTAYKELNSDTGNGHLEIDGVSFHRLLVQDKNWKVRHLSLETFNLSFNGDGGGRTLSFMTSWHDWAISIDVPWITCNKLSGPASNNVQNVTFTIANNDSGGNREATVKFHKIKRYPKTTSKSWEDGTEFHHAAHLVITQNTFVPFEF